MRRFQSIIWGLFAALFAGLASCSLPPSGEQELGISYIHQEKLLCVPTSAGMILAYYGDQQSPRKLKTLAKRAAYDPREPFSDFSITKYQDILVAVGKLGYDWAERSLSDDKAGFDTGIKLIRSELALRHPVMIDLSIPYGHTVVVSGLNDDQRTITVIDPEQAAPGKIVLSFDQLRGYWSEKAYGGAFRSLIVTRPKRLKD